MNRIHNYIFLFLFFGFTSFAARSQETQLRGKVYGHETRGNENRKVALAGASIVWLGTTNGVATDPDGNFKLGIPVQLPHAVVVSFIGYQPDTLMVERGTDRMEIVLETTRQLDEVVVASRRPGSHISSLEPILTNIVTESELQRAACCNLSEAFETNASVDVSFTDAVSGAQQIQLLGLAGIYSQILTENTPTIRGLGQPYGLGFIPGPWMEAIHISKGAGSVVNGYESITGQINVELKKPETSDMLFYNFYANDFGRLESSLNAAVRINDSWSGMVLAHGEILENQFDHNNDSFLDHPLMRKYNVVNRYRYDKPGVMESQFGFRVMQEDRRGGQMSFFEQDAQPGSSSHYGFGVNTGRYEAFARTGFFLPGQPDGSIGTQLSVIHHRHDSHYGMNEYLGIQNTVYANFIYENTLFRNPDHRINAGVSYLFDDYREDLLAAGEEFDLDRRESVPGVFAQYTLQLSDAFTGILGGRADFHNIYGPFFTPRLHIRAAFTPTTTLRASAGRGFRVPNRIAENTGLLVSNRRIVFAEEINPEIAWNYGASLTQTFELFRRDATVTAEYYRTDFVNQLIVDIDADMNAAVFYNLNGRSFANNAQVEIRFEPLPFFEVTAAYRLSDVKTTINDELLAKPFVNTYKGMLSGSWATRNNNWQVDLTAQFNGPSRIPNVDMLPDGMHMAEESPSYTIMHGQITRRWNNFDLYVGGENLTNFMQMNPIIGSHNPFEADVFDASMIWGPIMGRMFYMGLRYSIQ